LFVAVVSGVVFVSVCDWCF